MGKNATCLFSEVDNCYFITQVEDDDYESIYEDQVDSIIQVNDNEFIIKHDNGDESSVTF